MTNREALLGQPHKYSYTQQVLTLLTHGHFADVDGLNSVSRGRCQALTPADTRTDVPLLVVPARVWAGRGWLPYFRIYGPEEAAFDGSWNPGDFEQVSWAGNDQLRDRLHGALEAGGRAVQCGGAPA